MTGSATANREVRLTLGCQSDRAGVCISSMSDDLGQSDYQLSEVTFKNLRETPVEEVLRTELQEQLLSAVLSTKAWEQLRSLAEDARGWRKVRLRLKFSDTLSPSIPWEMAFLDEPQVTVVRSRHLEDSVLIEQPHVRVGLIDTITSGGTADSGKLGELHSYLRGTCGAQTLPSTFDEIRSISSNPGGAGFDVVHFTAHGGNNGGLKVRGGGATVAEKELSRDEIADLVKALKARLVVIAACGTPATGGIWTLAETLAAASGVGAVVAMREPILDHQVAAFSKEFYRQLRDGQQLDTAVLNARRELLREHRAIPQLHLNVSGDLRVWRKDTAEDFPAPAYKAPAKVTAIQPLPVVRAAGRLWQVACPQGQLTVYEVTPDDLGVRRDRSSVAVSADGRVAAAIDGDELDIGWLVATNRELSLKPLNGDSALQLPTSLPGSNAVILAVTVGADESLRFLVATDAGSFRLTLRWRGVERSHVWEPTTRMSAKSAQSGFVAAARTVLVADGTLLQVGSRKEVFEGGRDIAMADCAWFGNLRIAAAITASGEWIRTSSSQDSDTWLRQPRRQVAARGVAVVRQVAAIDPWLSTEPATPELAYVTNDDQVRLLDADPASAQ